MLFSLGVFGKQPKIVMKKMIWVVENVASLKGILNDWNTCSSEFSTCDFTIFSASRAKSGVSLKMCTWKDLLLFRLNPGAKTKIHKLSWIEWLCPYLRGPGAWSFGKAEFEQVAFGKIATDALKSASKTSSAWWRFICGMWCVSFDIYCTWTNAIDCNCIICCRHTEKILIIIT